MRKDGYVARPLHQRLIAGVLAALMGFFPIMTPVYAASYSVPTLLADTPINTKNQAKPNIILTVDDSTSMLYNFLPDYVVSTYCRDGTGAMNSPCGYAGSPGSAGPGGQYVSPQYVWEQPNSVYLKSLFGATAGVAQPFPATGTGAGQVPAAFSPQLFSDSGPGAGCNFTATPPSCTGGIDPGPLPGIWSYTAASGSPQAGLPYEYWQLWPAPAHNAALNHEYYDPRLQYDPPAYPDGSSYPQMTSALTAGWTQVPANPYLTAGKPLDCTTAPCVDLTQKVMVGQWCNSDWTQGLEDDNATPFVTDPGHCRVNGLVAAASAGAPAATGDYLYPWAPTGITPNLFATSGGTKSSKVDVSKESISPPTNAPFFNPNPWATAQDAKFFYENENVLWCDITSPDWPQTGPTVPQTCDNKTTPQTCTPNPVQPTCSGSVPGVCGGVVAAGTCSATASGNCAGYQANGVCTGALANGQCSGYAANGQCSGYAANGKCTGYIAGACSATGTGNCSGYSAGVCTGFSNGVCGGGAAAACNNAPTCGGAGPAACAGQTKEACVAGTAASCGGLVGQTCSGPTPIACNPVAQTCNGGGAQSCANITKHDPDPSLCTSAWVPAGCNINPDPESTCVYTTTCPPPTFTGFCSIQTTKVCASDTDCPFVNGSCSITGASCAINTDCNLKRCQATTTDCTANAAICGNVAGSGKCSITNASCTVDTDCPAQGTCNYKTTGGIPNGVCTSSAGCQPFPNHCAVTVATTCPVVGANSASCPTGTNSGTCNYQNNAGTANGPCTVNGDCKAKPNVCNNPAGLACASVANCTQGSCNYQNNAGTANGPCAVVGDCKAKPNTCTNAGATFGSACASAATCTDNGHCTNAGATNGSVCTTAATCTDNGTCTTGNVGAGCTANGATAQCALLTGKCTAGDPALIGQNCATNAACQKNGACTTGSIGTVCLSNSNTDVTCKKNGACTTGNVGAVCTTNSATDVACKKPGACTTGTVGAVCNSASATDVACAKAGACSTGSVGTSCTTTGAAAAADPACAKAGSCTTGSVGASCTAVGNTAQCALATGVCSNNANTCTLANAATQCGAVPGTCTAGNVGASCTVDSNCDKGNICSNSASNGAACATPANCTPLNGSCSFDTTIACTTNAQCTNLVGQCSRTGVACDVLNAATVCTDQPGPLTPGSARCDTVGVSNNNALTLLADANTNGKACRRNNHAYPDGTTASQFNYPSGKFTTPVSGEITAPNGCHATNRFTTVPRHYWVTEVEWCDKAIGSPADRWLGYGTPDVLYCIASNDASHPYPRFYQLGGTPTIDPASGLPTNGGNPGTQNDPAVDPLAPPAFARIDLDTSNPGATYTAAPEYGSGLSAVTRNFGGNTPDVSEMVNYANWFAYYRTRILAVKTVTSLAFLGKSFGTFNVDDSYRVGFHTLFNPKGSFVDIADFDSTQKPLWATQLFGINIPMGQETPTLDAMARIGDYFLNGGSAELAGSSDPIILSCQKNWHMLFTDGFTNQGAPKASAGDQDKLVPAYPDNATNPIPGLVPGNNWPAPLSEDLSKPVSDALADFAMQYWVTDLRTVGPNAVNNVPGTQTDPASWQHLNFAALSLGTAGTLPSNAFDSPPYPAWPKPSPVNKPGAAGVDDLWHAATSARGAFVNAQSADEVKLGMGSILADIANQKGARASAGFQNSNIAGTNNFIYRALFQPGWYGTLTKITIDPVTGTEGAQIWEAADQLQAQLTVIPGVKDTPWFTERNIATMDAKGTPIPFIYSSLSSAPVWLATVDQNDSLAPGKPARGKRVLEWIRGNTQFEGKKVGQFRSRLHAPLGEQFLGDIVDSKPVYVGPPNKGYLEQSNLGYAAFTDKWTNKFPRPPMIYVGANDGMVHAIDDATGNEKMAYVPSALYRGDATGLGALTYQDGALPPFTHHYLVDSTPKAWDVDFGGQDWHTVLVGGLGKGGMAYYALDITDPASITSEAMAVKSVLWEFTNQTLGVKDNLGYTYGQATIVKTHATKGGFTSGQWVAIVPSGYDNTTGSGDGKGHIFFVDIKTGKLLKEMSTGFGDTSAPSGLAQIAGYTKDRRNQVVEQVYGGDLYGNFWRFDVHDPDPANWVVEKLATLVDGGGVPQPVTIAPQIEIDVQNGVDRWVFIGTGRLLDDTDLAVSQQQTMYAIRDGDLNNPLPAVNQPTGIVPRTDMVLLADRIAGLAGKPDIGWFDDLPADQRIVEPIQADISVVAYIGTSPQTDPCLLGQPATVYARGFAQGESLLTDAGGSPVAGIDEPEGGVGLQLVQLEPEPNSTLYNIQIAVTLGTGKTIFIKPTLPTYLISHRMSWRLLNQ